MNCDAKRQGIEGIVSVLHQKEGNQEIHPRRPRDFLRPKSFSGVRTFSRQYFYSECIRKSFPVGREGLSVLKS